MFPITSAASPSGHAKIRERGIEEQNCMTSLEPMSTRATLCSTRWHWFDQNRFYFGSPKSTGFLSYRDSSQVPQCRLTGISQKSIINTSNVDTFLTQQPMEARKQPRHFQPQISTSEEKFFVKEYSITFKLLMAKYKTKCDKRISSKFPKCQAILIFHK